MTEVLRVSIDLYRALVGRVLVILLAALVLGAGAAHTATTRPAPRDRTFFMSCFDPSATAPRVGNCSEYRPS